MTSTETETEKPIVVTGRMPNSVRQQLRKAKSTTRKAKFQSKKSFKKIKLPVQGDSKVSTGRSCFKKQKSKTFKKVRFALPSGGILNDNFREPERMRMKNLARNLSKNHTMKHRRSIVNVREQSGGENGLKQESSLKIDQSGEGLNNLIQTLVSNGDTITIV